MQTAMLITSSDMLQVGRLPFFSRLFIVQTDASDTGVGATLLQEFDDGTLLAYASKTLFSRQRNFSVFESKFLAIVYTIQKFQNNLQETCSTYKPYIQKCKTESARDMTGSLFHQSYNFLNISRECFSRLPLQMVWFADFWTPNDHSGRRYLIEMRKPEIIFFVQTETLLVRIATGSDFWIFIRHIII